MNNFDYKELLSYHRLKNMKFSEYVERFIENPEPYLHTSSMLVAEAIKHFGYQIVVRSGEPVLSFNIFKDLFSNGVNAVFGQEFSIKKIFDVIESISKDAGPNRGIILLGPPASGKTNIVDLLTLALEQYSKEKIVKLYSYFYQFTDPQDPNRVVEIRPSFMHNPILFFTTILHQDHGITRPRQKLLEYIASTKGNQKKLFIPTYYQHASLDKRSLDIIESLFQNSRNYGKSLFDILEEYIRVEEIEFANAQALGIANIDDMRKLSVTVQPADTREEAMRILSQHLPVKLASQYEGALVNANRGVLHIHDAFSSTTKEADYKPLLMLLGSGKISLESSQTSIDTVVVITTNLDDMEHFDKQLMSSKLLDRVEKVPVNYLRDAQSEIEILKRDMALIKEKYNVDPNLFRIAAYFSVMTRLLPPVKKELPESWSAEKKDLYYRITPEQKMFIYSCEVEDPINTIKKLPYWHPFRNEAFKLGIDLYNEKLLEKTILRRPHGIRLESTFVFTREELKLIDDAFMRELWNEHFLEEGKIGLSVRQLQNIMRNTIANSDGRKILVTSFLNELQKMMREGSTLHHWLSLHSGGASSNVEEIRSRKPIPTRMIGTVSFSEGDGDYGNFKDLVDVVQAIYFCILRFEIITATVDRNPEQIEYELRKYIQFCLLLQAIENKAFAHIMVPKFSFLDPSTGHKFDSPDYAYMESIEKILAPTQNIYEFRREVARKFFTLQSENHLELEENKSLITSRNDQLLGFFEREYHLLLSHRRVDETIDGDILTKIFFKMHTSADPFDKSNLETREFAEKILQNMTTRFGYPPTIALDTIIFAIRSHLIDFKNILN